MDLEEAREWADGKRSWQVHYGQEPAVAICEAICHVADALYGIQAEMVINRHLDKGSHYGT